MIYGRRRMRPVQVKNRRRHFTIILCAVCLSVFFLFCISTHVYVMNTEIAVHELQLERGRIELEVTGVELEVAALRKAGRIQRIAQNELGMKVPDGAPGKLF